MNIGQVSKSTQLSVKQIRDYEKAGLLINPSRSEAGYRIYNSNDIARLKFIAKARSQIRNPENPDELVRMLNGLIRNRM